MSMNVQPILENVIIYCIIEIQIFMTFSLNCSNRIWGFIFDGVSKTYAMFVFKILSGTAMHKNSSETIKLCCIFRNPCSRICLKLHTCVSKWFGLPHLLGWTLFFIEIILYFSSFTCCSHLISKLKTSDLESCGI